MWLQTLQKVKNNQQRFSERRRSNIGIRIANRNNRHLNFKYPSEFHPISNNSPHKKVPAKNKTVPASSGDPAANKNRKVLAKNKKVPTSSCENSAVNKPPLRRRGKQKQQVEFIRNVDWSKSIKSFFY